MYIRQTFVDKTVTVSFLQWGETTGLEDVIEAQTEYCRELEDLGTADLFFTKYHSLQNSGTIIGRSDRSGKVLVTFGWNVLTIMNCSSDIYVGTILLNADQDNLLENKKDIQT